jgi:hypothetical protein
MRVFIELPEALIPTLEAEARSAHRPPRYHLEWMIKQELERIARGNGAAHLQGESTKGDDSE